MKRRLTVTIGESQLERLKNACEISEKSYSEAVRAALDMYLPTIEQLYKGDND